MHPMKLSEYDILSFFVFFPFFFFFIVDKRMLGTLHVQGTHMKTTVKNGAS